MDMGYVSILIVKDMSRLGRDYLQAAELFEKLYEDNVEGKVTDEWFL